MGVTSAGLRLRRGLVVPVVIPVVTAEPRLSNCGKRSCMATAALATPTPTSSLKRMRHQARPAALQAARTRARRRLDDDSARSLGMRLFRLRLLLEHRRRGGASSFTPSQLERNGVEAAAILNRRGRSGRSGFAVGLLAQALEEIEHAALGARRIGGRWHRGRHGAIGTVGGDGGRRLGLFLVLLAVLAAVGGARQPARAHRIGRQQIAAPGRDRLRPRFDVERQGLVDRLEEAGAIGAERGLACRNELVLDHARGASGGRLPVMA